MANEILLSWKYEVDWDRDTSYGHVLSDISAYVLDCTYRYGMSSAYQEVAPPARMVITLDNRDGAWSIERSGATFGGVFRKGCLVKLTRNYAKILPTSITHFIGMITDIQITVGALPGAIAAGAGEQIAILTVEDPTLQFLDSEYHPPLLTDVTIDVAIQQPFEDGVVAAPYPHLYWMLGIDGASELDTTTTIFENTITEFNTGASTLPYTGDNADIGNGVNILSYIREIIRSEAGGKFFWNGRLGKYVFLDRNHISSFDEPVDFETSNIVFDPTPVYLYADDLANDVEVVYELKKLGTPATILYTAPNVPITLQAGATRKFTARYQDPDAPTARVGGINMIPPTPTQDYTANSAADGSGSNQTSTVVLSVEFKAQSANVTFSNPTAETLYVTLFQLRGTPLTSHAKETAEALVGDSIFANGRHKFTQFVPSVTSAEFAQDYASLLANQRQQPRGRFERVTLQVVPGEVFTETANLATVGAEIIYQDESVENGETLYYIVGEEAHITGGNLLDITYVLEPSRRAVSWVLGLDGRSELGETTILSL